MTPQIDKTPGFIPLYKQLTEEYRARILSQELAPGDRIDSISEIMLKHGVSRETAKTVLKNLALDGLIVQQAGKGSFVANLGPLKKMWGIIMPVYSIQYQDLVYRLSQKALGLGRQLYSFVDHNSWEEEIRLVGHLINERYEAVVILPTLDESRTAPFYMRLSPRETHIALIDHTMAGSAFSYAIQSYDLGVTRGVQHLVDKCASGALAFVRNESMLGRNLVQESMESTFVEYLDTFNKRHRDSSRMLRATVVEHSGQLTAASMRDNAIGGVFCCDDTDAIRLIGRLKDESVLVGADYALVSYGNTELARYFTPAITSIDPHNQEMATTVADILISKIENRDSGFLQYVVHPELVIRET